MTNRSYGSSVLFAAKKETTYGVPATGNYAFLPFQSHDISSEQNLIASEILGLGREPRDPFKDIIKVSGSIVVPIDVRNFGFWLQQLFGDAVVTQQAATGSIVFAANPVVSDTITINSTVFTFVSGAPTGNQIQIGATLAATIANTTSRLNASVVAGVALATYSDNTTNTLNIVFDALGVVGNAFTLLSSSNNAVVSAPTLLGGSFVHTFKSGQQNIPSFSMETHHQNVSTFFHTLGASADSLDITFNRSGGAFANIAVMAQVEHKNTTTNRGAATNAVYETFNQFQGSIKKDGVSLGNVVTASFNFSNQFDSIETIRNDALIEGVDPTQVKIGGSIEARYGDNVLIDLASSNSTMALELGFTINAGKKIVFTFPRVFLQKPKLPVSGPGGVQGSFSWEAAYNNAEAASVVCQLYNDVASY